MGKVTAAVIEQDGLILLARRKKGKRWAGLWEFPGGKMRPGESPENCLRRELQEELGVEAEIICSLGIWQLPEIEPGIELLVYLVSAKNPPVALHDHDALQWVLPSDLLLFELTPLDREIAVFLQKKKGASRP